MRDSCVRPGHFFRCRAPSETDVKRVRSVNLKLREVLGGNTEFVKFCGKFALACAQQFAYAKVHGLYHGAISPSNISIDGRWLDLTCVEFVDRNFDYVRRINGSRFSNEKDEIKNILGELLTTYGKYNDVDFNSEKIVHYYEAQYQNCLKRHAIEVLGVSHNSVTAEIASMPEYERLVSGILCILEATKPPRMTMPEFSEVPGKDSLSAFILNCYLTRDNENTSLNEDAVTVLKAIHLNSKELFIKSAIVAFKKIHLIPTLYRTTLVEALRSIPITASITDIEQLLNEILRVADWILSLTIDSQFTIFSNKNYEISFLTASNQFRMLTKERGEVITVSSAIELIPSLDKNGTYLLGRSLYDSLCDLLHNLSKVRFEFDYRPWDFEKTRKAQVTC